ncbi:MAG: T9SS type A sorting domain-containing protein [Paludibacter sp.]|nr:T9SS type A sorting domain-containing protein [Paludibacter sp.]
MELHCQGSANLLDSTIVPQRVNDSTFVIDFFDKTATFGYYNFIVHTIDVYDRNQIHGELGKAVQWVQNLLEADTVIYATICPEDSIFFNGRYLHNIGIYYDTLKNAANADSIVQLFLRHSANDILNDTVTICRSELPFVYRDTVFATDARTGDYRIVQALEDACDRIINLHLVVISAPAAPDVIQGEKLVAQSGTYTYSIKPVNNAENYQWTASNPAWLIVQNGTAAQITIGVGEQGVISVTAINSCGSSPASSLEINKPTEIFDIDIPLIRVYPNPVTNGMLIIENAQMEGKSVAIYDIAGRMLISRQLFGENTIDVSSLVNGVYLLRIIKENGAETVKLIVK